MSRPWGESSYIARKTGTGQKRAVRHAYCVVLLQTVREQIAADGAGRPQPFVIFQMETYYNTNTALCPFHGCPLFAWAMRNCITFGASPARRPAAGGQKIKIERRRERERAGPRQYILYSGRAFLAFDNGFSEAKSNYRQAALNFFFSFWWCWICIAPSAPPKALIPF